jgi:YbgC/YbaW family acyl-CoA thioester hydrolase
VDQSCLLDEAGLIFVIVSAEARYVQPARFNDTLIVTARLESSRRTTMTFVQEVHRHSLEGEVLVRGRVEAACVEANGFRPRPIPVEILEKLERAK